MKKIVTAIVATSMMISGTALAPSIFTVLALAGTIGCETRVSCQTLVSEACICEHSTVYGSYYAKEGICEAAETLSNNGDKDACDMFYERAVPEACKGLDFDTGY